MRLHVLQRGFVKIIAFKQLNKRINLILNNTGQIRENRQEACGLPTWGDLICIIITILRDYHYVPQVRKRQSTLSPDLHPQILTRIPSVKQGPTNVKQFHSEIWNPEWIEWLKKCNGKSFCCLSAGRKSGFNLFKVVWDIGVLFWWSQ